MLLCFVLSLEADGAFSDKLTNIKARGGPVKILLNAVEGFREA